MDLAERLAELDVLQSLAHAATVRNYRAPIITTGATLRIDEDGTPSWRRTRRQDHLSQMAYGFTPMVSFLP